MRSTPSAPLSTDVCLPAARSREGIKEVREGSRKGKEGGKREGRGGKGRNHGDRPFPQHRGARKSPAADWRPGKGKLN